MVKKTKKVPPPGMVKCGPCDGEGYREDRDEDAGGRLVRDACYHCGTTGWIDEETAFKDRISNVAEGLAAEIIHDRAAATDRAAEEDQTGEGWAFAAAENMMTEHDYTKARTYEEAHRVGEILLKLDRSLLRALLDRLDPPPRAEAKPDEGDTPY